VYLHLYLHLCLYLCLYLYVPVCACMWGGSGVPDQWQASGSWQLVDGRGARGGWYKVAGGKLVASGRQQVADGRW